MQRNEYMGKPITKLAEMALERPESFGYWGDKDMFHSWGFGGITMHRDSDVLERSNFEVVTKDLMDRFPEDFDILGSSHWAVGHVDQLIVQILIDPDRGIEEENITEAFCAAMDWAESLQDYPIADESRFSEMEFEEAYNSIRAFMPSPVLIKESVDITASEIHGELMSMQVWIDPPDYCPTEEEMMEAAYNLGLFDIDYREEWDEFVDQNNLAVIMWDDDEPHVVHKIDQDKLFE